MKNIAQAPLKLMNPFNGFSPLAFPRLRDAGFSCTHIVPEIFSTLSAIEPEHIIDFAKMTGRLLPNEKGLTLVGKQFRLRFKSSNQLLAIDSKERLAKKENKATIIPIIGKDISSVRSRFRFGEYSWNAGIPIGKYLLLYRPIIESSEEAVAEMPLSLVDCIASQRALIGERLCAKFSQVLGGAVILNESAPQEDSNIFFDFQFIHQKGIIDILTHVNGSVSVSINSLHSKGHIRRWVRSPLSQAILGDFERIVSYASDLYPGRQVK